MENKNQEESPFIYPPINFNFDRFNLKFARVQNTEDEPFYPLINQLLTEVEDKCMKYKKLDSAKRQQVIFERIFIGLFMSYIVLYFVLIFAFSYQTYNGPRHNSSPHAIFWLYVVANVLTMLFFIKYYRIAMHQTKLMMFAFKELGTEIINRYNEAEFAHYNMFCEYRMNEMYFSELASLRVPFGIVFQKLDQECESPMLDRKSLLYLDDKQSPFRLDSNEGDENDDDINNNDINNNLKEAKKESNSPQLSIQKQDMQNLMQKKSNANNTSKYNENDDQSNNSEIHLFQLHKNSNSPLQLQQYQGIDIPNDVNDNANANENQNENETMQHQYKQLQLSDEIMPLPSGKEGMLNLELVEPSSMSPFNNNYGASVMDEEKSMSQSELFNSQKPSQNQKQQARRISTKDNEASLISDDRLQPQFGNKNATGRITDGNGDSYQGASGTRKGNVELLKQSSQGYDNNQQNKNLDQI